MSADDRLDGPFRFRDLRRRTLRGVELTHSALAWCDAEAADLSGLQASGAFVEHVSLRRADLRGADFSRAMLRHCSFGEAQIDDADFTNARLVYCEFDGASLRGSCFADATTVGCSFADAVLESTRAVATARDVVVEILRRGAGDDLEALGAVGLVALRRDWCWEHWAAYLRDRPHLQAVAARIFAAYPDSGCAEALAEPG